MHNNPQEAEPVKGEVGRYLIKPFIFESDQGEKQYKVRLVVAGTRGDHYQDFFKKSITPFLRELMLREKLSRSDIEIVSGMADTGADKYAVEFAKANGFALKEFPADWDDLNAPKARIKTNGRGKQYNANAGFDRNLKMARYGTHALVFWDGRSPGSEHMISMAKQFGLPVVTMLLDPKITQKSKYKSGSHG